MGFAPEIRQQFRGSYLPLFFTNKYREGYKDISRVTTKALKERYKQENELIGMVIEEIEWNISMLEKNC